MLRKAKTIIWAPNDAQPVDFSALGDSLGKMKSPEVRGIMFHAQLSATTGSDSAELSDLCETFARCYFDDGGCERLNVTGRSLRTQNYMEWGTRFIDSATIANGIGPSPRDYFLWFPFAPPNAEDPTAYHMNVIELLDGGQMNIQTGPANGLGSNVDGWTINSGNINVWFDVVEGYSRETKSRLILKDMPVISAEDNYAVDGELRSLILHQPVKSDPPVPVFAPRLTISSTTLDMLAIPIEALASIYHQNQFSLPNTNDPFGPDTLEAIPILPVFNQDKQTDYHPMHKCHLLVSSATNLPNAKVIISSIKGRSPEKVSAVFGTQGDVSKAIMDHGYVRTPRGPIKASRLPPSVAALYPIFLAAPGNTQTNNVTTPRKKGC